MTTTRQNLLRRFVADPPGLEGGLTLSLKPLGERRAWLRAGTGDHAFEGLAAGLSVPYASGLKRLVASDPEIDVALVEHAAPGFDRAAVDQGVGYLDLRGHGRLVGPSFVYVAPPTAPNAGVPPIDLEHDIARRSSRGHRVSPFAPKASRVARCFLTHPQLAWRLSEIAEATDMNPGNIHRVLAALLDLDLIERDGDDYVVPDPGSLLEAWSEQAGRVRPRERFAIPVEGRLGDAVRDLLDVLGNVGVVSGELAAELYAPHLPATSAIVHHLGDVTLAELESGLPPQMRPLRAQSQIVVDHVDEGVAAFGELRGGLPLVSAPQLYFDLYRARGRAREAAEHVRREVLSY